MKRHFYALGLMLAATFTLTNCAEEIDQPVVDEPVAGVPFEIVASTAETKTVNSGMSTDWAAEDQINLFHAVAGGTTYKDNNAFEVDKENPKSGRFSGMLAEGLTAASYDWYALYPYSEYTKTPEKSGYLPIGCEPAKSTTQVQEGNSNMKHIAGPNYPLWGNVKDVACDVMPSIRMSHVASLLKVVVTNSTKEPLKVETVQFTAPEDIVGTYYITFTGESVSCLGSGENYVSKTATLSVTDGEDIPVGQTAEFYLAIKPFVAEASAENKLTLSVNGYAKEMPLNQNVTFAAGKFKTLNFNYDKVVEPEPANVTWDLSEDNTSEVSDTKIAWTSDFAEMYCEQAEATTKANNYYGGDDNNRTSTRFYKNSVLTIAPKDGYKITSVVFTATSNSYASALSNSAWTNASAEVSNTTVTVTPTDGTALMTATISGTCGFTSVVVYYTENEGGETPEPEPKTLVSIAVETPQTEYTVGDSFVEPTVKATYDDASTATVKGATFTGNDLESEGTKEVTVSYTEGDVTATTTYNITVSPAEILVEDGTYVIAVKEEGVYYAASTEANGTRRAYVELEEYSSGNYVSNTSEIIWTITNRAAGITVSSGEQYWGAVKNGISMVESGDASMITVAKSTTDGAYLLSCDLGSDGIRYVSKNTTYGFGFYAESNKEDIYLIPATFVELPTLNAPVVEAVLNGDETGIDVSWEAVENATSYVVSCTNQTDQIVTSGTQCSFTDLPAGNYTITVTAEAEGYNSARSEDKSIIVPHTDTGDATVAPSGTILWAESWADAGENSTTFTSNAIVSSYTYDGRSGYAENATSVTYTADASNNVRITKSTGGNCTSGHLWFNKSVDGELKTSAIMLYGATSLTFSHSQGTSGSSCQTSYSIDGGSSWTTLGTQSGAIAKKSYSFEVPSGTESIMVKLSHASSNSKNTRVDNLELKVN